MATVDVLARGKEQRSDGMQVELFSMKVTDVNTIVKTPSGNDDDGLGQGEDDQIKDAYKAILGQFPVSFSIDVTPGSPTHGQVKDFWHAKEESEWSLNLKRGIISAFQVTVDAKQLMAGNAVEVMETDGSGTCAVVVSLIDAAAMTEPVLNILDAQDETVTLVKQRDYGRMCQQRLYKASAENAPELDAATLQSFVQSAHTFSASSGYLLKVKFTEQHHYDPHGYAGSAPMPVDDHLNGMFTIKVTGSLTLRDVSVAAVPQAPVDSMRALVNMLVQSSQRPVEFVSSSLVLTMDHDPADQEPLVDVPQFEDDADVRYFMEKAGLISSDKEAHNEDLLELMEIIRSNRNRILRRLGDKLNEEATRNVLIDVLVGSGRDDALQMVMDSIKQDQEHHDDDVMRVLMNIAYVPATEKMVKLARWYMNNPSQRVVSTAALSCGAMVFTHYQRWRKIDRFAWGAFRDLEMRLDRATSDAELVLYMQALGNAGQKSTAVKIAAIAADETRSEDVRLAAQSILLRMNVNLKASGFHADVFAMANVTTLPDPVWTQDDERFVVGTEKFGASAGYEAALYNPLRPAGAEGLVAEAHGYGRIYAFNRQFDILGATFDLQGDLIRFGRIGQQRRPVEAYIFFSIGGMIWTECLDILGNVCGKRRQSEVPVPDGNCQSASKRLLSMNVALFRFGYKVPLLYGLTLDLGQTASSHIALSATARGCRRPNSATAQLVPEAALDLIGSAFINLYLIQAGAQISARLFATELTTSSNLEMNALPLRLCNRMDVHQNAVAATVSVLARVRDKVKYCGDVPCWLDWGHEFKWSRTWPGFRKGEFQRELLNYCAQWPRGRQPNGQDVDADMKQETPALLVQTA